jgi:hypothetical protein
MVGEGGWLLWLLLSRIVFGDDTFFCFGFAVFSSSLSPVCCCRFLRWRKGN